MALIRYSDLQTERRCILFNGQQLPFIGSCSVSETALYILYTILLILPKALQVVIIISLYFIDEVT